MQNWPMPTKRYYFWQYLLCIQHMTRRVTKSLVLNLYTAARISAARLNHLALICCPISLTTPRTAPPATAA